MAITYNSVDFRGVAAEPIIEELLFENDTIANGLVTFEEDVKAFKGSILSRIWP